MGGLPLEFINKQPQKGGPPLEFINIQPPKRGPPLEFINQRGIESGSASSRSSGPYKVGPPLVDLAVPIWWAESPPALVGIRLRQLPKDESQPSPYVPPGLKCFGLRPLAAGSAG